VGRSHWRHHVLSSKETLVPEETQTGWRICRSPGKLPNCCKTGSVLEYACPVWHSSLSKQQTKLLEDVQRRTLQIIVGNTPYAEACCMLGIHSVTGWQTSRIQIQNCVEHFSSRLLTMSSTVFIVCCLQSVTLSWLADYGLSNISCANKSI